MRLMVAQQAALLPHLQDKEKILCAFYPYVDNPFSLSLDEQYEQYKRTKQQSEERRRGDDRLQD